MDEIRERVGIVPIVACVHLRIKRVHLPWPLESEEPPGNKSLPYFEMAGLQKGDTCRQVMIQLTW